MSAGPERTPAERAFVRRVLVGAAIGAAAVLIGCVAWFLTGDLIWVAVGAAVSIATSIWAWMASRPASRSIVESGRK